MSPRAYLPPSPDENGEYAFDPTVQTASEVNDYLATAPAKERERVLKAEKAGAGRRSVLEGPHGEGEHEFSVGGDLPPGSNSPIMSAGGSVLGADGTSGPLPDPAVGTPVVPLPADTTVAAAAESDDAKTRKAAEATLRERDQADKQAEKDAEADAEVVQERTEAEAERTAEQARTAKSTSPRQTRSGG